MRIFLNTKKRQSQVEKETDTSLVSIALEQVTNECPECHSFVPNQPTNEELRVMTDEARLRVIKAMKVSAVRYSTKFIFILSYFLKFINFF